MVFLRVVYRLFGLLATQAVFAVISVVVYLLFFRSRKKHWYWTTYFTQKWAGWGCYFLNIRIKVSGEAQAPEGALIISNHVGSADIFVLGSLFPAFFVSKAEVSNWPVVGRMIRLGGTIFVNRSKRHGVGGTISALQERMTLGFPVIMFPEGRATDGSQVIPFKSSTFEAAVQAARPVLPVVLHYHDGNSPTVASWINEPFFNHFFRLVKNSRLEVTATILPPVAGFQDRRLLTGECHRVVSQEFEKREPKS